MFNWAPCRVRFMDSRGNLGRVLDDELGIAFKNSGHCTVGTTVKIKIPPYES